jgi:hypothetical protein
MLIAASAVLLLFAIAAYWRLFPVRAAWWLLGLRIVVMLLLGAVLVGSVVERRWAVIPSRVAVLVDRSESMTAAGLETMATRAALNFPLGQGMRRELWGFGDSAYRVHDLDSESAEMGRTDISRALDAVFRTRPAAVVLVSDGQDNGLTDPVASVRGVGVPVYAVGCGRSGQRNIEAAAVSLPAIVYAGDTVEIRARVRYCGLKGEQAVVRLDGDARSVLLRDDVAEQELVFRAGFPRSGVRTVRLSVDSLAGEDSYLDNERSVTVEVKPGRLSVVYVANRPGPGSRFLARAMAQDPRIGLSSATAVSGAVSFSREGLDRADVLVLDNAAETSSDAVPWQEVLSGVKEGKGALVLAGPGFRPGAYLKQLLPGGSGVRPVSVSLTPVPTQAAGVLPWLADLDFQNLPPFAGAFIPDPAAVTEPWLQAGDTVLACAYEFGQGRVVYVAGFPLWRWAFGRGKARPTAFGRSTPRLTASGQETESGASDALAVFILGAVRFLASSRHEQFALETDKPGYYLGEPVRVAVRAVAPDGRPWTGLDLTLSTDGNGPVVPMTEQAAGVYQAVLAGLDAGEHEVQAVALLGDSVLGMAATSLAVADRGIELSETGLDERLLRELALASGGAYFRCDSLPSAGFRPRLATIEHGFSFDPRRTPWVYVIIALVAGLEWVLRRRRGLL